MWGTRRGASSTPSSCGPAPKQGGPEARQGHAKTDKNKPRGELWPNDVPAISAADTQSTVRLSESYFRSDLTARKQQIQALTLGL